MECETDIDVLSEAAKHMSLKQPAGIIVHMTRCGSTAVVNALRTAEDTVVLSEAPPIEGITHLAVSTSTYWATIGQNTLRALVTVYGNYQGEGEFKDVIIKCGIEGPRFLPLFRALWPGVPCLIMIRDPLEVMVSNLEKPASWFLDLRPTSMTPEPEQEAMDCWLERGAREIGRLCAEMLGNLYDSCVVMDAASLNVTSVRDLAARCGLRFSAVGTTAFQDSFLQYSKNPKRVFVDDRERKQRAASERLRTYVDRWAAASYGALKLKSIYS
jgi:hypothetical protein